MKKNEGEGDLIQVGSCGPHCSELAMVKTLTCGPRMKTTKKTKMIAEKSSFQKYKFGIVLRFRNLSPDLV